MSPKMYVSSNCTGIAYNCNVIQFNILLVFHKKKIFVKLREKLTCAVQNLSQNLSVIQDIKPEG